jgi:predicted kinase
MSGKIWILCGLPGAGKSTWVKNNLPNAHVICRDSILESVAAEHGISYDDSFKNNHLAKDVQHIASSQLLHELLPSTLAKVPDEVDIVVDMTNLSSSSRRKNCPHIKGRSVICVFFNHVNNLELIYRSLDRRYNELGWKKIPKSVIISMLNSFEMPDASRENFGSVQVVDPQTYLE